MVYVKRVKNAEITAYLRKSAVVGETSHDVHSGLEDPVAATEALQTASDDTVLLKNSHPDTVFCQKSTGEKATYTTPCYDRVCIHFSDSIICL